MNNSSVRKIELEHVVPQYKLLFGKSTTLDEVIDVTDLALKAIGNKAQETFSLITTIKDFKVNFPCDVYLIKSVTRTAVFNNGSLYKRVNDGIDTVMSPGFDGNTFPYRDVFNNEGTVIGYVRVISSTNSSYNKNFIGKPQGDFVDFNNNGQGQLTFNVTNVEIEIIYKASLLDVNDLPLVDEKTVTAICYYINYLDIQRKYFGKTADANMYQLAVQLKEKHVGQARIGDMFTDNQTDRVLNHALSLGRKMYNLPNRV